MSLKDTLRRYKPGVTIRTHLLLGAVIWTLVGIALLGFGFFMANRAGHPWYGLVGLLLGTAKSFFVLDRVSRKNIRRIKAFEEKVCFGSVYSWKTWLLVAGMIVLGRYLRTSVLPGQIVGLIYTAVGGALMMSSRLMWTEWLSSSK